MSAEVRIKLAFAFAGIVVWAIGVRLENATVRWIGIGAFVAAFLLRFLMRSGRNTEKE